jgi:hypothetical protein
MAFLDNSPEITLVLKTGDERLCQSLETNRAAIKTTEYRSFTSAAAFPSTMSHEVIQSSNLSSGSPR